MGGGYSGDFIGGKIFGEGSDGQKWLSLGGAFAGGFAGARGYFKHNENIARKFFEENGVPKKQIKKFMSGIDRKKRVSEKTLYPGEEVNQFQIPENRTGHWFSPDKTAKTTNLGTAPIGTQHKSGLKMQKERYTYKVDKPTEMLRSTAARTKNYWSVKGKIYRTKGGATQWFSTSKNTWEKVE